MHPFKAYITDLDGTLCDTLEANMTAYSDAFSDAGLFFDTEAYKDNFGLRFEEMMKKLAPSASEKQLTVIQTTKSRHYEDNLNLIKPNFLLIDLLKVAHNSKLKLGLSTTAREKNARMILSKLDIEYLFDAMVFGEDVHYGKPDPECYSLCINTLGFKPKDCLIFEDSTIGVQAAKSSGAYVIRVSI